jgi:Family of unknown function (DUF6232)
MELEKNQEHEFFNKALVVVTSATLKIEDHTFATKNVGSVRIEASSPPKWPWFIVVPCALIALIALKGLPETAGILITFGVIAGLFATVIFTHTTEYTLVLFAGGGESKTLVTHDHEFLIEIKTAIEKALTAN